LCTSFYADSIEISRVKFNINTTRPEIQKNLIIKKFPQKKFAIYDYKFDSSGYSQSLALFLYNSGQIDDKGFKIGYANTDTLKHPIILRDGGFVLYDISALTAEKLKNEKWIFVNPSAIYHSGQDWYKK
jgi:hypothetical protein